MSEAVRCQNPRRGAWVRLVDDETYVPRWVYTARPERYVGASTCLGVFEAPPHLVAPTGEEP
jgi:hypothetical protein